MTPAEIILPFLLEANRRKPHLRIDNRFWSCFELLEDTLALAGPDWHFVGKTAGMDGAAVRPTWFAPRLVPCLRPDGQTVMVSIDGLSMDAAWHLPSMAQVKVIANSTANEPGDHEKGPARLTPYMIPKFHPDTNELQWRWHNPPVAQRPGIVVKPMPSQGMPSYEDLGGDAYWRTEIGRVLQADLALAGQTMNDGSSVWFSRPIFRILHAYASGQEPDRPAIIKSVRNEWRAILGLPVLP